jgi:MFS family permease
MLLADRLKLRYSAHRILMAGILLYVLMRGLVLLAPSVAMILVVRAIGGFGFSFYLVGLINLIGERSEEDQVARWLAFYTVTLASLINMTSAPLTGLAFDLFGAYWLYALSLAGYLIGFVILFFSRPNRPRASVGG